LTNLGWGSLDDKNKKGGEEILYSRPNEPRLRVIPQAKNSAGGESSVKGRPGKSAKRGQVGGETQKKGGKHKAQKVRDGKNQSGMKNRKGRKNQQTPRLSGSTWGNKRGARGLEGKTNAREWFV